MHPARSTSDPDNNNQFQKPPSFDELHLETTENIYHPCESFIRPGREGCCIIPRTPTLAWIKSPNLTAAIDMALEHELLDYTTGFDVLLDC